MRFHGKRFLRQRFERASMERVESRDAIVWTVITAQRMAQVKIQGSNELLNAYYQEGVELHPIWLRPGSPVRISHRGGVRGRWEILGLGHVIPTPLTGGSVPTRETAADGILTGMEVTASAVPDMFVTVHDGTYQINGITYTLEGGILMTADSDMLMGNDVLMGSAVIQVEIDPAPAVGYWRFDLICIGADGVVDYIAGTPATSDPVKPTLPSAHVKLAYVLVPGGATSILQSYINVNWSEPMASQVVMIIGDDEMLWTDPITTSVTLQIKDQYSMNYNFACPFTLEILAGNGQVWSAETGWSETAVSGTGYGMYGFYYRRNHDSGDHSPVLRGTAITYPVQFVDIDWISLYDEFDAYMPSY